MVLDIGRKKFEISVVEKNTYKIIEIDGGNLGGDDFDEKIKNYFFSHIKEKIKLDLADLESRDIYRLSEEARRAKEILSEVAECYVHYPSLTLNGKNYDLDFTRQMLEKICKPLFDIIFDKLKNFLKYDIDEIILSGETCNIPYIREKIKSLSNYESTNNLAAIGAAHIAEKIFERRKFLYD